jgi:hypothetical protein
MTKTQAIEQIMQQAKKWNIGAVPICRYTTCFL